MRIQSPLSHLSEILKQVVISAKQYQATLATNEAATRAVLIDPVLRALGWDTANPHMVEVEKYAQQNRVDYALNDHQKQIRIIVEAKSLGTNLEKSDLTMSLVNYAFAFNLRYIFLTDGVTWVHFTDFQPGNIRVPRILNLANDNLIDCAGYLVQHLDAAKFWPMGQDIDDLAQKVQLLETQLSAVQQELEAIKQVPSRIATQATTIPTPVSSPLSGPSTQLRSQEPTTSYHNGTQDFIELDRITETNNKRPCQMLLPDGSIVEVRNWRNVLQRAYEFIFKHYPQIRIPLPDRSGKKIMLLNYTQPHNGSFDTVKLNDRTVYIYTNYDSLKCILNAHYLFEQLPQSLRPKPAGLLLENRQDS